MKQEDLPHYVRLNTLFGRLAKRTNGAVSSTGRIQEDSIDYILRSYYVIIAHVDTWNRSTIWMLLLLVRSSGLRSQFSSEVVLRLKGKRLSYTYQSLIAVIHEAVSRERVKEWLQTILFSTSFVPLEDRTAGVFWCNLFSWDQTHRFK